MGCAVANTGYFFNLCPSNFSITIITMTRCKFFSGIFIIGLLSGSFVVAVPSPDQSLSWPIEIESEQGAVTTLYQPQLESFQENELEGRMAVTIKLPEKEMIFGAIWFRARLETDLDNRTVTLEKMEILRTHFPDIIDEAKITEFSNLLSAEIESWDLEMSLDRILASLDEVENLRQLSRHILQEKSCYIDYDRWRSDIQQG